MFFILFIVGFIGNLIGTLAGGGGLITLPTMLLLGMPIHSSIGANKVSNTVSTFSNVVASLLRKDVQLQEVKWLVLFCLTGGLFGGFLASAFSETTLQWIAIILLIFAFIVSFIGKTDFGDKQSVTLSPKLSALLFGIGTYDGLFGPGSGTLVLYSFANAKLQYYKAVVYGRVCIFATCLGAAIVYIANGHIIWTDTLALMIGSIIGSQFGMKLAKKVSSKQAKILLRCITTLLIVQLILEMIKG